MHTHTTLNVLKQNKLPQSTIRSEKVKICCSFSCDFVFDSFLAGLWPCRSRPRGLLERCGWGLCSDPPLAWCLVLAKSRSKYSVSFCGEGVEDRWFLGTVPTLRSCAICMPVTSCPPGPGSASWFISSHTLYNLRASPVLGSALTCRLCIWVYKTTCYPCFQQCQDFDCLFYLV